MPGLPETIPSALNEKSKIPDRDSVPSAAAPIIVELMQKSELEEALVGIEPTSHYWFDLGQFMGGCNSNRGQATLFLPDPSLYP